METLRYHCVQTLPLWFITLRSEDVVKYGRKNLRPFLFIIVMEMLKYTCLPSFTSIYCMVCKFDK